MSVTNKLNAWVNCLANNGIQHVYISPGSRNAPLIRAFVQNLAIKSYSVIDERSAGFLALGAAIALKKPVALLCTSGTALLNYYPALTEAFYSGIPLLAISADRPADLIDQWEGQCIRQNDVFSNHLGKSVLLDPTHHDIDQLEKATKEILDRLNSNKPVHVNIPLSEPLYSNITTLEFVEIKCKTQLPIQDPPIPAALLADLNESSKILFLNGHSMVEYRFKAVTSLVFNDVVSNKWSPNGPIYWDALFLSLTEDLKKELAPDLLITTGTSIISKPLRNWLRTVANLKQWHIGKQDPIGNPFFKDLSIWPINEVDAFELIAPHLESKSSEFNEVWKKLDSEFEEKRNQILATPKSFNEPTALHTIYHQLDSNTAIHLANSSAVRYASWLGWNSENKAIFSNRGASGIDGCSSTAVGFALHCDKQVVLITGDVAFFYDINAFWGNGAIPKNLKVVLLNNGGGGIFNLINGPEQFENSLGFQTTQHNRKGKSICGDLGIQYFSASNYSELEQNSAAFLKCEGAALLEIETIQSDNVSWVQQIKIFIQRK